MQGTDAWTQTHVRPTGGNSVPESTSTSAAEPRREIALGKLIGITCALLLAGGVLLDLDRISAVRDVLDRVASVAAIEAAASTRPGDRTHICQKRFNRAVWTDTEVTVDDVSVSVDRDKDGRTATVSYDATVKLAVGRFFGFDEVSISGEAEVPAPERQAGLTTP
jgi:hypothetical protein